MKTFTTFALLTILSSKFALASPVPEIQKSSEVSGVSSYIEGNSSKSTSQLGNMVTVTNIVTLTTTDGGDNDRLSPLSNLNATHTVAHTILQSASVYKGSNSGNNKTVASVISGSDQEPLRSLKTSTAMVNESNTEPLSTNVSNTTVSTSLNTSAITEDSITSSTENFMTSTISNPTATSSTSQTSSASGSLFTGEGTYFTPGLGACGGTNSESDYIVAVSQQLFNANDVCGKKIEAFYGDKKVTVEVVDSCVGCAYNDLDFSPAAFSQIADESLGRINISWKWV